MAWRRRFDLRENHLPHLSRPIAHAYVQEVWVLFTVAALISQEEAIDPLADDLQATIAKPCPDTTSSPKSHAEAWQPSPLKQRKEK